MKRNRFLVRPSYQRSEVINLAKASAIIESIVLGIMLPAIFIYKRENGVSEVIDGQQRLLTILAFSGQSYLDKNNNISVSKSNNFKLRDLKILDHLNGKTFNELSKEMQDKIWEFELFVVEIEERLNPHFNPVDLFIRLNDKPFPIRENSFEMWNSWAEKEIILTIKKLSEDYKQWFFITNSNVEKFRDRMLNEELLISLAYFEYRKTQGKSISSFLDIYQKGQRINARVKQKKDITALLMEITENEGNKSKIITSIKNINNFILKVQNLLTFFDNDLQLKESLDALLSTGSDRKYYRRTLQDFYVLWFVLEPIDLNVQNTDSFSLIYRKIKEIFVYMNNCEHGYTHFSDLVTKVKNISP